MVASVSRAAHLVAMRRSTFTFFVAFAYVLIATGAAFTIFRGWHYDDPFITYRYADNLVRGFGFIYNAGERVLSTTTPLFGLMLAALGFAGADIPSAANLIGCVSMAIGGLCLWDLGWRWRLPFVAWAGLLLYPTFLLLQITLGSETPLYLALCLGAFALYERKQYTLCAVCCALATLARGDGVLLPLILVGDFALRMRGQVLKQAPWRAVSIFFAITLAWFSFAWSYYGTPLPVTLAAKRAQGQMAISQTFAIGLFTTIWQWYGHLSQHRLGVVLAALGVIYLFLRRRRATILVVWTVLYFVAYAVLGVSGYFWYYAPLVPGFVALIGLGLSGLMNVITWLLRKAGTNASAVRFASLTMPSFLLMALFALQVQQSANTAASNDARYSIYRAAGEWLRDNTSPQAIVGTLEVGIIGYYSQRTMLDFAGLIQPGVARRMQRNTTYEDTALYAVERYRPNYVLLLAGGLPRFDRQYVQDKCALLERLQGEQYAFSADLLIYACRRR